MRALTLALTALFTPGFASAQVLDLTVPLVATTSTDVPLVLGRETFDAPRFEGALAAGEALRLTVSAGAIEPAPADIVILDGAPGTSTVTFAGPGAAAALDGLRFTPPPGFAGGVELTFEAIGRLPRIRRLTVAVNAPLDADAARDALLDGVAMVHGGVQPGHMLAFGASAADIGWLPGGATAGPLVAAARWGAGRVVAMGDHQALNMADFGGPAGGDSARFYHAALGWLSGRGDRAAAIVTLDEAVAGWLRGQGYADVRLGAAGTLAADLADADVFVPPWLGTEVPEAAYGAIGAFVRRGGGLLIAEYGVGWRWWWGRPLTEAPGNRLLRQAGIAFVDGYHDDPALVAIERASGQLGAAELRAILAAPDAVDDTTRARAARVLDGIFEALPPSDPLRLRVDAALGDAIEAVSPTPDAPVDDPWDKALLLREADRLEALSPEAVPAHRVAEALYGAVPADAERLVRWMQIDPAIPRWHTTGLYAPPGEVIEVELPPDLVDRGYVVHIGGHTDDIRDRARWLRPPRVHRSASLDAPTVRLASPFGGAIYVDVGGGDREQPPFGLVVSGGVLQPRFTLGEDVEADWLAARDLPAPYAELASPRLAISLPSAWIRDLAGAGQLMAFWDDVVAAHDTLGAHADLRAGPERIDVDVQVSRDARHPGYPIQASVTVGAELIDLDLLRSGGGWDWLHVLGHEAQRRPDKRWPWDNGYTFDDSVETTADLFAVYAAQTLGLDPPDDRRWAFDRLATMRRALDALAGGATYAGLGPVDKLAMFLQLRDGFGWQGLRDTLARYHDAPPPADEQAERDAWLVRASQATGHDLSRFLGDVWGIPLSAAARAEVAGLPSWLPALGTIEGPRRVVAGVPATFDLSGGVLSHDGIGRIRVTDRPIHGALAEPAVGLVTYTADGLYVGPDAIGYDAISSTGHPARSRIDLEVMAGGVTLERWRNLPGASVADLRADPRFPGRPDAIEWLAETTLAPGSERDFGARMRGFVVPARTDAYVFRIAAAAAGELWISSDHRPENIARAALAPVATAPGAWDAHPAQRSAPIRLEAGRAYYFEALVKVGADPGHLAVAWAPQAQADTPRPIGGDEVRAWRGANRAPLATDGAAQVPPDVPTALALDVRDPDGDAWHIVSAGADRGAVQVVGGGLSYTSPPGYEGPDAIRYRVGDGRGGEAEARIAVTVFEPLRIVPIAPVGGWVGACAHFRWRPVAGGGAARYVLGYRNSVARREAEARLLADGALGADICDLSDGGLSWWVDAYAADGRRLTTAGGEVMVDRLGPLLDWSDVTPAPGPVCVGEPFVMRWAPIEDGGAGLAPLPYQVEFADRIYPPTAALEQRIEGAPGGWQRWVLTVEDAVGNRTTRAGDLRIDCVPPPLAQRWTGHLTAADTPDAPVDTGLVLDANAAVEVKVGGALCFTDDRACDPPIEPTGCATALGAAPGEGPPPALDGLPPGGLVAHTDTGWQAPDLYRDFGGDSVYGWLRGTGPLALAVNHAGPTGCRRPGFAVSLLVGPGIGLSWPIDGAVTDAEPELQFADLSPDPERLRHFEVWLDGERVADRLRNYSYTPPAPLAEGRHTWSVAGADAAGNRTRTAEAHFVVDLSPPEPFAVTLPAEGADLPRAAVDVCWRRPSDVSGVDHYRVYLDERPAAVVDEPEGRAPEICVSFDAEPGERCVQVDAYDLVGHTTRATRCFSITLRAPDTGLPDAAVDMDPPDAGREDADPPDAIVALPDAMPDVIDVAPDAMPDAIVVADGRLDMPSADMGSGVSSDAPSRQPDGCHTIPGRAPVGWPLILLLWLPIRRLRR